VLPSIFSPFTPLGLRTLHLIQTLSAALVGVQRGRGAAAEKQPARGAAGAAPAYSLDGGGVYLQRPDTIHARVRKPPLPGPAVRQHSQLYAARVPARCNNTHHPMLPFECPSGKMLGQRARRHAHAREVCLAEEPIPSFAQAAAPHSLCSPPSIHTRDPAPPAEPSHVGATRCRAHTFTTAADQLQPLHHVQRSLKVLGTPRPLGVGVREPGQPLSTQGAKKICSPHPHHPFAASVRSEKKARPRLALVPFNPFNLVFLYSAQCLMVRRWRLIGYIPLSYIPPPHPLRSLRSLHSCRRRGATPHTIRTGYHLFSKWLFKR
jgi:hypothetical protein